MISLSAKCNKGLNKVSFGALTLWFVDRKDIWPVEMLVLVVLRNLFLEQKDEREPVLTIC